MLVIFIAFLYCLCMTVFMNTCRETHIQHTCSRPTQLDGIILSILHHHAGPVSLLYLCASTCAHKSVSTNVGTGQLQE